MSYIIVNLSFLFWVPEIELLNPWTLLGGKTVFLIHEGPLDHTQVYAKEMTWMEASHDGKTNHTIKGL